MLPASPCNQPPWRADSSSGRDRTPGRELRAWHDVHETSLVQCFELAADTVVILGMPAPARPRRPAPSPRQPVLCKSYDFAGGGRGESSRAMRISLMGVVIHLLLGVLCGWAGELSLS